MTSDTEIEFWMKKYADEFGEEELRLLIEEYAPDELKEKLKQLYHEIGLCS